MSDSWENKRKSKRGIGLTITLCIVLVVIGFLVYNNSDLFKEKQKTESIKPEDSGKAEKEIEASKDLKTEKDKEEKKGEEKGKEIPVFVEPPKTASSEEDKEGELEHSKEALFSVDLPAIKCALADEKGFFLQVSLKVYFKEKKLEKEILFKRDNIKVVVIRTLVKKHLSELVVQQLRFELKKEINALLEEGKIEDIEFLDFRPIGDI